MWVMRYEGGVSEIVAKNVTRPVSMSQSLPLVIEGYQELKLADPHD